MDLRKLLPRPGPASKAGSGGRIWTDQMQIMMGVLTCVSALLGYAFVPNFPAKATFLNPEERKLVNDRITIDRHDFEEERLSFRLAIKHLGDWKIWS